MEQSAKSYFIRNIGKRYGKSVQCEFNSNFADCALKFSFMCFRLPVSGQIENLNMSVEMVRYNDNNFLANYLNETLVIVVRVQYVGQEKNSKFTTECKCYARGWKT